MPRKTKQQKMAAALRRMKNQIKQLPFEKNSAEESKTKEETIATVEYNAESLATKETKYAISSNPMEKQQNYAYVSRDLRKIFILSLIAISLEVALSLTTRLEFAKLLLRRFGIEI